MKNIKMDNLITFDSPSWIESTLQTWDKICDLDLSLPEDYGVYTAARNHFITKHEGSRDKVYLDSLGIRTIGVGLNLDTNPEARCIWATAFYLNSDETIPDFDQARNGEISLKAAEIDRLLTATIARHEEELSRIYAPVWHRLTPPHRLAIEDLFFNGGSGLVGKSTNFHRCMIKYYFENNPEDLEQAVYEVKCRSNPEYDRTGKAINAATRRGLQKRRDCEAILLSKQRENRPQIEEV